MWYPDDSNDNHPPRDWIKVVWRYLQEHFTTVEDILGLGKLPLIPLSMAGTPVTLTRLCHPSRVVVKRLNDDCLDDKLAVVLMQLGLIVMTDYPTFIRHHPAVLGTFVNPPTTQGVLHAMVVSSNQMTAGTFSGIVRKVLSSNDKHLLRSFLANVKRIGPVEYNLLCSLPIFETLSKKFVSEEEGLCAAPDETLPVAPLQELIDVTQQDSKALARILNVKILKPTELLCQIVFPDIQRGRYSGEQIDKLMTYVLDRYASEIHRNTIFKQNLEALSFVSKQEGRARASDLFDSRNVILRKIFAKENVFPTASYTKASVLVMLEELGMKSECSITGYNLYQSANLVSRLSDLSVAEQKSKAIFRYVCDNPSKLLEPIHGQPLWALLRDIPWVSRLQKRPPNYPPGLAWWKTDEEEGKHFFKPTEVKSHHMANLIGTVMPVVEVETSCNISKYFNWQNQPSLIQVVQHLQTVVRSYSKEEKPFYMVVVNQIYLFLSRAKYANVNHAFDCLEKFDWVWNGDGFSSPNNVLSKKPHIDLAPYIRSLPSDMIKYCDLFYRFGMRERSDPAVLVQVLTVIKEKYDDESVLFSALEVKHDLQLSVNILNELANEQLSDELQAQIVLPTHIKSNSCVRLEPVERCMYCEREWLKREGDDEDIDYFYVHPNVPNSTAERLGVPTLTNRMLDADELSIGEEFGQTERLTTRLNRLLEEYTDGFSVLKELVQNADDAGATEVRFLYDERTNEDAMTCLLDEGMKGCQGPALWVYNDAEFKDEDFENIVKLNEATKEHDTEKIGRFGLGFNAVYNLTDVPMFLSRNYFVIFDPHTSYLGKAITKKRRPGMKIDLNKDVKKLRKFANQFKPFNGVFGCDLHLDKEDNSFDGTLFRFPLRTREQAIGSEIKKLYYDEYEVRELLQMLVHRANSLLLFTQNVLRVGIYSLPRMSRQHSQPALLFEVVKSKSQVGIFRELHFPVKLSVAAKKLNAGQQSFLKQCNFLQASSKAARDARYHTVDPSNFPKCSITVDIDCSFTNLGLKFFNVDERSGREHVTWLVVSAMGNGEAMQFAKNDKSLVPSGGAAVRLVPAGNRTFLPLRAVVNEDKPTANGVIFCYLPLPIHSGLPLHINGAFAVAANRRHLQVKLEDDKECRGADWNNTLMQDSILSAYLCLLEDVKSFAPDDGSYKFHSLWPRAGEVHRDCWPVLKSFYTQLASGHNALFSDGKVWAGTGQVVFLDPEFRMEPQIGDSLFAVFKTLANEDEVVIDLPADVFQSFNDCGLWEAIQARTYDKSRFFRELFFPNILKVRSDLRDTLVLHVLDDNSGDFNELMKTHACIPASPCGETLKYPGQLVHPNRKASSLFCPDDGRFPSGTDDTFLHLQRLTKLEQLGMVTDDLPWKDIAERAESIDRINAVDSKIAVHRVKALLSFMEAKMKGKGKGPSDPIRRRLVNAKCLPVLRKPKHFPLRWKGDEFRSRRKFLVSPKDVFPKEEKYLVCSTEPIVDLDISTKVKELLKLRNKDVTIQHVMSQLEEAISISIDALDHEGYDEVKRVCTEAYSFLQEMMSSYSTEIKEFLLEKKFILVGKRFLSADQLALELNADCSPYLYRLPEYLSDSCLKIMKLAGVKEQFEEKDFISSLQQIELQFRGMQLDEQNLEVTVNMATQLGEKLEQSSSCDSSKVQEKWGYIYLPTSRKVMRPVSQLCIKDCPWMADDDDDDDSSVQFANGRIPWPTCTQLGVKTRREEALQDHDSGIPYGQREKLTTRLKHILEAYRCEKDILKELLQNADDAQATEICFIKDPRYHAHEKVPKDSWKPLQGPALCVYNNKPFTNADIEGIQNLGDGSKGDDPNKTGQYGVGFNAVYHLTDVPSFMSRGEEIGDVLCVFDPHCKYVPKTTDANPGRRYKNINEMNRKFPDVFHCYLEDHFPIQNATMFRFPLRSEEMAESSKISPSAVTVKKLDEMMEGLKKELFEVLLFVNNVKKIRLCEIDESTGDLIDLYSVEVLLSQEDDRKRQAFADHIKEIGIQAKLNDNFLPTSIKVQKCMYSMTLRDTFGREEKWLIVQQVGFEKSVKQSIVDAFKKHQLGMLPRGGVACLLESTSSSGQLETKKKAYCFLPLPFETDLPIHINGHFALDHEARRSLWRDEIGGYRTDWNNALLCDVMTSCYLTLLDEVRAFLQLPIEQDRAEACYPNCCRSTMLRNLSTYEELFPRHPIQDPHWKRLVDTVYHEMSNKRMRLIPVVRNVKESSSCRHEESCSSERVQITWFSPTGTGKDKIYFNNLERTGCFASKPRRCELDSKEDEKERKRREESRIKRKSKFEETLLETGFNLVAFSMTTFESLREAGVEVVCVSPSAVMDFYKSFSFPNPLCSVGKIPCPVHMTPFKNYQGVIRVLKYCKDDEQFLKNLSGLPLLLTQDNYLSTFSESNPRCLSHYQDILPSSPSIFVHKEVRCDIFNSTDWEKASVFRPLDVDLFASFLYETLPHKYFSEDHYVKWCPDIKPATLPNRRWIYRVWSFLQDFAKGTMTQSEISEEDVEEFIRELLSPLSKWSLLPATKTIQVDKSPMHSLEVAGNKQTAADHFLVPLHIAESVLDFSNCGTSDRKLVDSLRSLGLPEVNSVVLTTVHIGSMSYTTTDSYKLVRNLVASLKAPKSLLIALKQILETNPHYLEGKLQRSDAIVVLEYFSRNVQSLTDVDKGTLRKLPFYPTTRRFLAKLEDTKPCIIPDELPKEEIGVVESILDCLFLKSVPSLSELYEFLDVECVSPVDAYLKFVFKCFQHLSEEGKLAHIRYISQFSYSASAKQKNEKEIEKKRLLDYLKTVEFIPTKDGKLLTASSFYDPRHPVFSSMLSEDMFPPEPFAVEEWLLFLEKIGLVQDVSQNDFRRFATQVAHEAATMRTENTYKKSSVLVDHLISRHDVVGEGLLQIVRDIPFVAADSVTESLQAICPPFGGMNDDQVPFIAFNGAVFNDYETIVWTKAHLLPEWADLRSRQYQFDRPPGININQYCNEFLAQLKIAKKPSVNLVVDHCQTVCKRKMKNASSEQCSTLMAVMESIYTFLQENAITDSEAKELLETTRCILVERGRKFILPSQAVLELYESLEIKPYLYRVPPAFGKFQRLFEYLGCFKSVTATHYAMVLDMLRESCQNARLHPNEVTMCSKAVKGFFKRLEEDPVEASTLSNLYLPATFSGRLSSDKSLKNIPLTLHKTVEMVFDDAPAYAGRIDGLNQPFVVDLSLLGIRCKSAMMNNKELMMKLPQALQPKMLSCVVNENFTSPENVVIMPSGAVNALRQRLSSPQFGCGIVRIVRHVNSQKKDFDEEAISNIENGLRNIEICAVESLKTSLFHNGKLIPGSEAEVTYFQKQVMVSGKEIWMVYVNSVTGIGDTNLAISLVANVISEIYGDLLGQKAVLISDMFRCPLGDIWHLLDRAGIRQDDTYDRTEIGIYPEPGTFIPIEDHHLLNDAFLEFEPEEYVGYQLHDPSLQLEEGVATYIYALIIKELEVMDEDSTVLAKMYLIDIGQEEPVVVNAAVLHKFHRLQEISDEQREFPGVRDEQVIFGEISAQLEDAWRLPEEEEQRRQIVKRLVLRWHPEKNLGDEEFCSRAFEYIKNEIARLGGSYDEYIGAWVARAKEHGSHREEYRERFAREYGSWEASSGRRSWHNIPPSFCSRNPQPGEARRWFRQAEADLTAGANEIDSSRPSYEWACFKCHQVELALLD